MALLPGNLSATLHEGLARLGTWMPFAQAAEHLAFFWRVQLGEATVRRHGQAAGAAWVALQTEAVERLEREQPDAPPGPARQQVSVDGAMVPLVGGEWAEVKTLAIGTIEPVVVGERPAEARTRDWSYFSRLADVERFTHQALVEVHRRGTDTAGTVVAPVDGSEWCQAFLDVHCPDAVRVLDFPHALEHLSSAAQATFGPGTAETSAWLGMQAHTLKHADPGEVLAALRTLPTQQAADPDAASLARDATLAYLEKRRTQIQYAQFLAQGYPIGSGGVESANKLVVEARLKGSGMHWARRNVDPMLALRTIACSNRWEEAWPQLQARLRAQTSRRRAARRLARRAAPTPPSRSATASSRPLRLLGRGDLKPASPPTIVDGRPTPNHLWKKQALLARGRARARK